MKENATTWLRWSALAGAVVWSGLVVMRGGTGGYFKRIEELFWLAPLVVVPLGLGLVGTSRLVALAMPVGATLAVGSFFIGRGGCAAWLAAGWMVVCGLAAIDGWGRGGLNAVSRLYLLVGSVWLVLSRAGAEPSGFVEPIVLLTAVHFHFTGFAVPVLAAQVRRGGWWIVGATPVLAAGFVFHWPWMRLVAAVVLAASLSVVAVAMLRGLSKIDSRVARALLCVAAVSVMAGMGLAMVYALGEAVGVSWITIPRMARTHGYLNGLGFCLCGLLGWTLVRTEVRMKISSLTRRWQ